MGVICNGPRKSGTNALRALIIELGIKEASGGIMDYYYYTPKRESVEGLDFIESNLGNRVIGSHSPFLKSKHKIITLLRDPRNIALSYFRAMQKAHKKRATKKAFKLFLEKDVFFNVSVKFFLEQENNSLLVWFEDLFEKTTVKKIAKFIDVPYKDVSKAFGKSPTWSGKLSNHQEWFNDNLEQDFFIKWYKFLGEAKNGNR